MWSSKRFLTSKFIRNLRLSSKPPKNRLFKPFTFKTVVCITAGISLFKLWENKQMFTNNKYECQGTKVEYSNPNVKYLTHPIIPYLMSRLRDPKCTAEHFRVYSDRIMQLLIEEAISQEPFQITQELSLTGAYYDDYKLKYPVSDYCAITVIRSGDSMLGTLFDLMPGISVGKILVQRNEESPNKEAIFYYSKLPKSIKTKKRIFVLDPMLGTGGSCKMCVQKLLEAGVDEESITFINLISCPSGLDTLVKAHPKMKIITAVIDPEMNEHRYLIPGLGDFGDRYFNST